MHMVSEFLFCNALQLYNSDRRQGKNFAYYIYIILIDFNIEEVFG
jgi:hypothetical protein